MNDIYQEIRPYNDSEVKEAIRRLVSDNEFLNAIIHYRFANMPKALLPLLKPLLKQGLLWRWRNVNSIQDVQMQVATYMSHMIERTTDGLTVSGLDKLDPSQSYLFVSNHRDIAMDPALVNWSLHLQGRDTVRIAIGDNLLKKPCATELMKLNKSFIVKRSITAPRELMKALTQLSGYIHHSLKEDNQSVWIAQREGRAKDGNDKTDPAILKMFYMQGKKDKLSFADTMKSLKIVPVSISYENDPCDIAKASELDAKDVQGFYEKSEFEDIDSIVQGIVGQKRRVHVAFGELVEADFETPEELAQHIDQQIADHYHLFPVNYIAAGCEHDSITDDEKQVFHQKLATLNQSIADRVTSMYAMPVGKKHPAV
uniref:1-acyl-sn-glycerol-3-phosphate acyltransferase n=1 Tax=Thaumasiovibrio occultus TaxID=1891184 RepID=UPI000B35352B|nr:1-acyl-sn-glycerol-3-phosphate acyltransferase [Thaumasiovibrio occultus]